MLDNRKLGFMIEVGTLSVCVANMLRVRSINAMKLLACSVISVCYIIHDDQRAVEKHFTRRWAFVNVLWPRYILIKLGSLLYIGLDW